MAPPDDPYARGGLLLDVRTPQETAEGHFPGALLIPIDELGGRISDVAAAAGGRDVPILVMCKLGRRAERATRLLQAHGFRHVCNIGGVAVEPLRAMLSGVIRPDTRSSLEWAHYGLQQRDVCYRGWLESLAARTPNYNALVGAYRHAYGAELNFHDAGVARGSDGHGWHAAEQMRRHHAAELEATMGRCP